MPALLSQQSPPPLHEVSLGVQLRDVVDVWGRSQHRLVVLAAEFADSHEWLIAGSPTAAHWLAGIADVEVCTAREWIRIGRMLCELPATADAFAHGRISYSKVRTLSRVATPENERELLQIARRVPAGDLGAAIAAWMNRNSDPVDIEKLHHRQRSVKWRTEPDGMVTFMMRLQPLIAGMLIAILTAIVMRSRPSATKGGDDASASFPSLAQQHADALAKLLTDGAGNVDTEVVLHVRGDGCTLDDGTPIADTVIERLAPESLIRVLIHDADSHPVNASGRQRHPSARQKRVVKDRDRVCRDCGGSSLLEYDHVPAYTESRQTVVDELELRCASCHRARHVRD